MFEKSCLSRIGAGVALFVAIAAAPAGAAIVVNGGFETGDFTGWTLTGNTSFSSVVSDAPVPQSGTFGASFGPFQTTGGISQSLATTAGTSYIVDFWLQGEADVLGAAAPNSFQFSWNGSQVSSLLNSPAFDYKHFVFNLTATGSTTLIAFSFRDDPAFLDLDNVNVTAVPEPETWALIGLGLAVVAARRRRSAARS